LTHASNQNSGITKEFRIAAAQVEAKASRSCNQPAGWAGPTAKLTSYNLVVLTQRGVSTVTLSARALTSISIATRRQRSVFRRRCSPPPMSWSNECAFAAGRGSAADRFWSMAALHCKIALAEPVAIGAEADIRRPTEF
jgi:hypothetical protein